MMRVACVPMSMHRVEDRDGGGVVRVACVPMSMHRVEDRDFSMAAAWDDICGSSKTRSYQ